MISLVLKHSDSTRQRVSACSFYLSAPAHGTIYAEPSLRYNCMLLGRLAVKKVVDLNPVLCWQSNFGIFLLFGTGRPSDVGRGAPEGGRCSLGEFEWWPVADHLPVFGLKSKGSLVNSDPLNERRALCSVSYPHSLSQPLAVHSTLPPSLPIFGRKDGKRQISSRAAAREISQ